MGSESIVDPGVFSRVYLVRFLPAMNSASSGLTRHWAVLRRQRRELEQLVAFAVAHRGRPPAPLARAAVRCVRFSHAKRPPDADNLAASFKPLLDGLVKARVLEDDGPHVATITFDWQCPPRGVPGWVELHVKETP